MSGSVEPQPLMKDAGDESWVPKVGMEFETEVEAYRFYYNYARRIGYSIRKNRINRRVSGVISLRVFVCHKEGVSGKKKEEHELKIPKLLRRTGCPAALTLKIMNNGKYRVSAFEPKHNHPLVRPDKAHLVKWRRISIDRGIGAEDSGKAPEETNGIRDGDVSNGQHLVRPSATHKSYLQSRRDIALMPGDAGAVLQYVQEKQAADPSFYFAVQLDADDRATNFFWTDGKSMADYDYFSDVVCCDTMHQSAYGRQFTQFVGVNHHKQTLIFGAALLYDESVESFKWLFKSFEAAMEGKQPRLVFTDQSMAVSEAIAAAWPDTVHRISVLHVYRSAANHLNVAFQGSKTFAHDFSKCIYNCEEEEEFLSTWKETLESYDLKDNEWLAKLYEDREKWALPYGRHIFCADITSTLRRESLGTEIKELLSAGRDLLSVLRHYERAVDVRRHAEVEADFQACEIFPTVPPTRILRQAANAYTPAVFKMFQKEFEMSLDCMVYSGGEVGTISDYNVKIEGKSTVYVVRVDISDGTVVCSCKKFETVGVQCHHVLKVLDIINIKELPPRYILKRWRKDAKIGSTRDKCELAIIGDPMSYKADRYRSFCRFFNKIAARAAESMEAYTFIDNQLDQLMDQVDQILQRKPLE